MPKTTGRTGGSGKGHIKEYLESTEKKKRKKRLEKLKGRPLAQRRMLAEEQMVKVHGKDWKDDAVMHAHYATPGRRGPKMRADKTSIHHYSYDDKILWEKIVAKRKNKKPAWVKKGNRKNSSSKGKK